MIEKIRKITLYLALFLVIVSAGLVNWRWPIYTWFGDIPFVRFVWLGVFFLLLDLVFELFGKVFGQLKLVKETLGFGKGLKKISDGFKILNSVSLPNNVKADYIVIGSSGIWLIDVRSGNGRIEFSGDDLLQDGEYLKGLISGLLEKSYSLVDLLKKKFGRDFTVTPVISFSSPEAVFQAIPKQVRGVYISSGRDIVSLVENTDVQLIDKNTNEEIYKFLRNK